MSMTKKDYELVARTFRWELDFYKHSDSERNQLRHEHTVDLAQGFADVFAKENSKFDRQRFLTACGINTIEGDK